MEQEKLKNIRNRDCFKKEDNFIKNKEIESILVYGKHNDIPPFVTIIMPTYKRSDLIGAAIKSVLEQKDFDDYQLLIVDNEGIVDKETETERIIINIDNNKILYYKNVMNLGAMGNWNRCIELSKSEWLCMVHDDDLLADCHLKLMSDVVKKYSQINYLTCQLKEINERENLVNNAQDMINEINYDNKMIKYIGYKRMNFESEVRLLGAFFKQSCATELGGFNVNASKMEDYFFIAKYAKYYGIYYYPIGLYGYRWRNNDSLSDLSMWQEMVVHAYYGNKAIIDKRFIIFRKILNCYNKYEVMRLIDTYNDGTSFLKVKCIVDKEQFCKDIGSKSCEINKYVYKFLKYFIKIDNVIASILSWPKRIVVKRE
jgi:glycosyltransferase involved in cell wall biosynthesis